MNRSVGNQVALMPLHEGQVKAYWALQPHRFKALRCGRRWGKTDFAKIWIVQALAQGHECAWLAPQHKTWSEVYAEIVRMLGPLLETNSKGSGVTRTKTGGRLD